MTRIDAPPEFGAVTLRNRHTWHRATLLQWINTYNAIVKRISEAMSWAPDSPIYNRTRERAIKRLWREEARAGRPTDVAIEGQLARRLDQIIYQEFVTSAMYRELLTDWEEEFLNTCVWLNELEDQRGIGRQTLVGLLAEWVASVEAEFDAGAVREKKRREDRQAVAGGRVRTHRGQNPYYPSPIDLLGIWRAVMAIVARIQWEHQAYESRAADRGPSVPKGRKTARSRKPRGADFLNHLKPLFDSLRTQGFSPAVSLDEILGWKAWTRVHERGCSTFATEMTARLFGVKATTVQRDLTAGSLKKEYRRYRVPRALQHPPKRPGEVRVGVIRECQWYRKRPLVGMEVIPGHVFFPPPSK